MRYPISGRNSARAMSGVSLGVLSFFCLSKVNPRPPEHIGYTTLTLRSDDRARFARLVR